MKNLFILTAFKKIRFGYSAKFGLQSKQIDKKVELTPTMVKIFSKWEVRIKKRGQLQATGAKDLVVKDGILVGGRGTIPLHLLGFLY
jgi:hypothetical protein